MLCPDCGADLDNWQEVFGEPHSCPAGDQKVLRVLSALHRNGLPFFLVKDLTTPELDSVIKGEG